MHNQLAMLAANEPQLRLLIDMIQEFIVLKDGKGRWLITNQQVLDAYKLQGIDYQGKTDLELAEIQPELRQAFLFNIETDEKAWEHRAAIQIEKSFYAPDGVLRTWEVVKTPVFDEKGQRNHLVIVSRDVTERKKYESRLEELAFYDHLTNVSNRRFLLEKLPQEIEVAEKSGSAIALFYLDIDHFKRINDTLGHEIGDELLVHFVKRLQNQLRPWDIISRIGGDEFVVVLTQLTDRAEAEQIAEQICSSFKEPWLLQEHTLQTTSSIGIAMYPEHGQTLRTLLFCADKAMYQAKANGRGRTQFFCPTICAPTM